MASSRITRILCWGHGSSSLRHIFQRFCDENLASGMILPTFAGNFWSIQGCSTLRVIEAPTNLTSLFQGMTWPQNNDSCLHRWNSLCWAWCWHPPEKSDGPDTPDRPSADRGVSSLSQGGVGVHFVRLWSSGFASFCAFGAEGVKFVVEWFRRSFHWNLDFNTARFCAFGALFSVYNETWLHIHLHLAHKLKTLVICIDRFLAHHSSGDPRSVPTWYLVLKTINQLSNLS